MTNLFGAVVSLGLAANIIDQTKNMQDNTVGRRRRENREKKDFRRL